MKNGQAGDDCAVCDSTQSCAWLGSHVCKIVEIARKETGSVGEVSGRGHIGWMTLAFCPSFFFKLHATYCTFPLDGLWALKSHDLCRVNRQEALEESPSVIKL